MDRKFATKVSDGRKSYLAVAWGRDRYEGRPRGATLSDGLWNVQPESFVKTT